MFLNYVGSNFGQSMKASILGGELVSTEAHADLLPKIKTKEEKTDYLHPGIMEAASLRVEQIKFC